MSKTELRDLKTGPTKDKYGTKKFRQYVKGDSPMHGWLQRLRLDAEAGQAKDIRPAFHGQGLDIAMAAEKAKP